MFCRSVTIIRFPLFIHLCFSYFTVASFLSHGPLRWPSVTVVRFSFLVHYVALRFFYSFSISWSVTLPVCCCSSFPITCSVALPVGYCYSFIVALSVALPVDCCSSFLVLSPLRRSLGPTVHLFLLSALDCLSITVPRLVLYPLPCLSGPAVPLLLLCLLRRQSIAVARLSLFARCAARRVLLFIYL